MVGNVVRWAMLSEDQAWLFTVGLFALAGIIAAVRFGRWHLLQIVVFAAVLCGNVYFRWTPNPYLAGIAGIGAAFIATVLAQTIVDQMAAIRRGVGLTRRARPEVHPPHRPDWEEERH